MEEPEQGGGVVGRASPRHWEGGRSEEQRVCAVSGRDFYFSCSWLICKDSQNSCNEQDERCFVPSPRARTQQPRERFAQTTKPSSAVGKGAFCFGSKRRLQPYLHGDPGQTPSLGEAEAAGGCDSSSAMSPITAEVERTGCGCNRHSRKEQGWKMPSPFYLETFRSFASLFHPLEHPHVSRHFQHLSLLSQPSLSFPEAQRVSRRPGAERETPKKLSPAPINGLIPAERLWSCAQPRARESCQREGKEGEREEARALPAGAD